MRPFVTPINATRAQIPHPQVPELRVGERCLCSLRIGRKKFFMLLAR